MRNSNGQHYVPSSKIRSAADIERAAAGVIDVDAKTTTYVVLACVIAASGGVLFGYDGGVTGDHRTRCWLIAGCWGDSAPAISVLLYALHLSQAVWSP